MNNTPSLLRLAGHALLVMGALALACGGSTTSDGAASSSSGSSGASGSPAPTGTLGGSSGTPTSDASTPQDASSDAQPPVSGPYDACKTAADCGWGEINAEITKAEDCICLMGCAFLPLSKDTIARRQAQYDALCTPNKDGKGNPCPVDDCVGPPPIDCIDNRCVANPDAGTR